MKVDSLLPRTLAEDVSGFDDKFDMQLARVCAELAQIRTDIEPMPMETMRPSILILDEGTSHLDLDTEKAVNAALSAVAITRLVVAHRPETLRAAGRVLSLQDGVLLSVDRSKSSPQAKSHENA